MNRTALYNKVTVLSCSVCLLVGSQVSTVYPSVLTSVFVLVLRDACEMPVIHSCDSGWAIGPSCSGAPAEAQFPFCSVMYWSIQTASRMHSTAARSACAMDLRVMLARTQQPETEPPRKKKKFYFILSWDDLESREKPAHYFKRCDAKPSNLFAACHLICILNGLY